MSKYQNGKIYLIKSNETEMVYIGSTHGTLEKRFASHKSDYKRRIKEENFRPCHSYEILKYSDAYIELIEDFPCNTKQELLNREGEITKNTPNRVNIIIQGRNMKQYRDDNKEKLQKQGKEYAIKNREKINAQARLFYSENKEIKHEKRREYELSKSEEVKEKERTKKNEYYQENKVKINEDRKIARELNKEEINEKRREKMSSDEAKEKKSLQDKAYREKYQEKAPCDICGTVVLVRRLKEHKKVSSSCRNKI